MSVMAARPQQFSDMQQQQQQQQYYGSVQQNAWTMATATASVDRASPFPQPRAPLYRQLSSETSFCGALSPEDSTNNSSLQSSPAGSPAAHSPEHSEIAAAGCAAPLNKVSLPRVMSVGEARNHRRKQATKREARRAVAIRKAFTSLEECIPGHDERSCTRLETLEHATNYIVELAAALKQSSGRVALLKAAKAARQQQASSAQYTPPTSSGLLPPAPLRMDTPPAESTPHAMMGLQSAMVDPTASVFPTAWPQATGRLSHAPRPQTMPMARSVGYQAAAYPCTTVPTSLASRGALAPDLNMLDIDDLFRSPDGMLSDESTSWTEYLDSNITEAVN